MTIFVIWNTHQICLSEMMSSGCCTHCYRCQRMSWWSLITGVSPGLSPALQSCEWSGHALSPDCSENPRTPKDSVHFCGWHLSNEQHMCKIKFWIHKHISKIKYAPHLSILATQVNHINHWATSSHKISCIKITISLGLTARLKTNVTNFQSKNYHVDPMKHRNKILNSGILLS